ncbi:hypothetical protein H4R19_001598 [Coemansia spiralis]|nr:hypothetical protein H4R19_001598 [Coemansia spiralis]
MGSGAADKISAQEEADLSSALIAKLLAEDSVGKGQYSGYYDDYGDAAAYGGAADDDGENVSGNEGDGDWDPSMKRRRKPKAGGRPRRHGADGGGLADPASSGSELSDSARGGQARKAKRAKPGAKKERPPPPPVPPGQYRAGAYTEDEERLFREGLETYGRSWAQISDHVVTRDAKSIRSHAQKYLIKLFRDNAPLPAKVRESGDGYTLSGRPLDPNSAAARPYLQHVMQLDPPPAKPNKQTKPAADADAGPADPPLPPPAGAGDGFNDAVAAAACAGDGDAGAAVSATPPEPEDRQASPGRTEYAMSRPRRSLARPVALRYNDPHQMVRCTPFAGLPLSGAAGCQPFRLVVHTNAQLEMDFHAHLMLSEVIGLLGGRWDAAARVLVVARAFPCAALETTDAHTNVEMDPGSELVVRHQITDAGLRVVGWYHSHPTFRPDPSIIDIENQTAYQKLFRDSESAEEPFVGAIVGPYDPELPGPVSVFNWFCVGRSAVDRGHPKRLAVETAPDRELPVAEQAILLQLLDDTDALSHRAPLAEAWRPASMELRSLKMAVSLAHRMPWILGASASATEPTAPAAAAADDGDSAASPAGSSGADCASDTTAADADGDAGSRGISPARALAGQRAAQDPLLSMLCRRFTAGIFKAGSDPDALAHVLAASFPSLP